MPSGEQAGAQIDRYKLLEQIGEGGMGTIWLAEQREPVIIATKPAASTVLSGSFRRP